MPMTLPSRGTERFALETAGKEQHQTAPRQHPRQTHKGHNSLVGQLMLPCLPPSEGQRWFLASPDLLRRVPSHPALPSHCDSQPVWSEMVLQTSQVPATKVKCFPSCCLLYLEKVAFVVIKCSHDVLTFSHPYKLFSVHCRLYSFTMTLFFNSSNESCVFCSKPGSKSHRQLVLQPRLQGQLREKTTLLKKKKKAVQLLPAIPC